MSLLELTASDFRQFGEPSGTFCLITHGPPGDSSPRVHRGSNGYSDTLHLRLPPEKRLGELLRESVPPAAHVLVVCPGRFLDSPSAEELGDRKLAVLPAGSTPLTDGHVRYYLEAGVRADPAAQEAMAEEFLDQVGSTDRLRILDEESGTEAEFDHTASENVWNQQGGVLEPGEQQIFPSGKLSVTAAEISTFRPEARLLGLNGELTLRGWPIVHRHADPADGEAQGRLFDRLSTLVSHPVILRVTAGSVTEAVPGTPAAKPAADALNALLEEDSRYRTIWELGFGMNTNLDAVPANCGPNEVWGGSHGVLNLGLGLTPTTRFALAFLCPHSSLLTSDGTAVLGPRKAVRRGRMRRVSSSSCGCH